MMSITKGPWFTVEGKTFACVKTENNIVMSETGKIAYVFSGEETPYSEKRMANAHLIAAAPEMYEFIANLQLDVADDIIRDELLAKARGEK